MATLGKRELNNRPFPFQSQEFKIKQIKKIVKNKNNNKKMIFIFFLGQLLRNSSYPP